MPLSLIKTNSIASGNITSALIASVANTAIVGRIATAQQPTGAVLQLVSMSLASQVSSSSVTYADIGLTATITPISSSSKIIIIASFGDTSSENNSGPAGNKLILYRNSTQIGGGLALPSGNFANQWNYAGESAHQIASGGTVFVDTPSSTSALTYKFQGATQTAGKLMQFMRDNTVGTLILMEVAG